MSLFFAVRAATVLVINRSLLFLSLLHAVYPPIGMRRACKKINSKKGGLVFSVQMNHVPGFGLLLQYALPYLETGQCTHLSFYEKLPPRSLPTIPCFYRH